MINFEETFTKREKVALKVAEALLRNHHFYNSQSFANSVVNFTDALLKRLEINEDLDDGFDDEPEKPF